MKICIIAYLFVILFAQNCISSEKVSPLSILTPPVPDLDEFGGDAIPMIFTIIPKINDLEITFLTFQYFTEWRYQTQQHQIWGHGSTVYHIADLNYTSFIKNKFAPPSFRNQSDLEYNGADIIVDGNTIVLQGYVIGPIDIGDDYKNENHITCVRYSAIKRYLGIISHSLTRNELNHDRDEGDSICLYSSENGEPINFTRYIIDAEGNTREANGLSMGNGDCEIFLSPDENFLIGRYFQLGYNKEFGLDVFYPKIAMIDVKNKEVVEADKDVAFTHDSQFFVTERNGAPCLVRSSSKRTLLTYKVGAPMLAAAFSPDDKTLYISAIDNKIYVFDSGINSGCEEWELLE